MKTVEGENWFYHSTTRERQLVWQLTGHGCVEGEGPEAGELFASGFLHAVTEDVLPGVQLQQLNTFQDLGGLLQAIGRVLLRHKPEMEV